MWPESGDDVSGERAEEVADERANLGFIELGKTRCQGRVGSAWSTAQLGGNYFHILPCIPCSLVTAMPYR